MLKVIKKKTQVRNQLKFSIMIALGLAIIFMSVSTGKSKKIKLEGYMGRLHGMIHMILMTRDLMMIQIVLFFFFTAFIVSTNSSCELIFQKSKC